MLAMKGEKLQTENSKWGKKIMLSNWYSSNFSKPNADGNMCFLKPMRSRKSWIN